MRASFRTRMTDGGTGASGSRAVLEFERHGLYLGGGGRYSRASRARLSDATRFASHALIRLLYVCASSSMALRAGPSIKNTVSACKRRSRHSSRHTWLTKRTTTPSDSAQLTGAGGVSFCDL